MDYIYYYQMGHKLESQGHVFFIFIFPVLTTRIELYLNKMEEWMNCIKNIERFSLQNDKDQGIKVCEIDGVM